MASNHKVLAENNIESLRAEQFKTLAVESDALIDRHVAYRNLIDEEKKMIRCMFEFTRLLMANARETVARADQILDGKFSGMLSASDRASRPRPLTAARHTAERVPF